jgi:rhodanese-related sulfurtransferase
MAAGLVAELGYKNIMVYKDGIPEWGKAGHPLNKDQTVPRVDIPTLNPSQLKEMLGEVYVLDVRLEPSYKKGYIKGSKNIPIHLLSKRYAEVPKGKKVVIVDALGNPHYVPAGWFLKSKGYSDVNMLNGTMEAWEKEGLPLEK